MKIERTAHNFDFDFGSVSIESIMDTLTRVYLGITVLSLAVQVVFPFYNHLIGNRDAATQSVKNFTTTYLTDVCFNASHNGDPAYGTCATPIKPIT
ncbi:MAG: hypothetical protein OI715_00140 (plasmid) [Candidatus Methanoperedens sp.]|nr:MAG: hypothetical protein OI715_00140 [Candidatus Methanoperedens sp.]